MKKFSKILCLVLVVVMMAGLCAVGTTAAYTDADKITYKEAVDVMSALGVLQGDDRGFRPADGLTRAEACKIIAYVVGCEDLTIASSFKDTKGHWAENYIGFCAAEGYVNGVGNGKFDPDGALTGTAFAKMLLCATGYNADKEGMTGDTYELAVAKLVKAEKLAKGITGFNGAKAITREQAAQLAFNTVVNVNLRSFSGNTVITGTNLAITTGGTYTVDGTSTLLSGPNSVFGLTTVSSTVPDDFGRPQAKYFRAENKATNTSKIEVYVAKTPVATYTSKVTAATVAADLEGYTLADTASPVVDHPVNNATTVSFTSASVVKTAQTATTAASAALTVSSETLAKAIADETANGKVVEIYADTNSKITEIVEITYSYETLTIKPVKATTAEGAYNSYGITSGDNYKQYTSHVVAATEKDTVVLNGTFANKDKVVTVKANNKLYVYPVTEVTGVVSAVTNLGKLTVDGAAYEMSTVGNAVTPTPNTKTQTLMLDPYGYVIATKGAAALQYAFMMNTATTYTLQSDNTMKAGYTATLAFPDGTVKTVVTVDNAGDPQNCASVTFGTAGSGTNGYYGPVTYVENANGTYTLTKATDSRVQGSITALNKNTSLLGGSTYATASTKFVYVNYKADGTTVANTVTIVDGLKNIATVASGANAVAIDTSAVADGIADVVYVYGNVSATTVSQYIYVTGTYTQTGTATYAYDIFKGGVADTIVLSATDATHMTEGLYSTMTVIGKSWSADEDATALASVTGVKVVDGLLQTKTSGAYGITAVTLKTSNTNHQAMLGGSIVTVGATVGMYEINTTTNTMTAVDAADMAEGVEGAVYVELNAANDAIANIYVVHA